ncbi:hypothetical protein [Helicobacter ganmani]|uniref:hypothetical protein n=1 Tax=Helicobacter ganmani TaxID=60246 RepID=UPI003A8BC315
MNIKEFEVEKIANIIKQDNDEKLKVEKLRELPKGKLTLLETNNGEITNVFESSNPNSVFKFYENGGIQGNGKPCESNFAKHELAKQDIKEKRTVEIYMSSKPKKEILTTIKEKDGKYPSKNFQLNKERIPKKIVDKFNKIKQERSKKNDT